jgi:hypothetical protein
MKYCKILINLTIWHLKPYKLKQLLCGANLTEYGFLCFKLIITGK